MIVLSLIEKDPQSVRRLLVDPPDGVDAIEVRLDAMVRREPGAWFPGPAGASRPVIAACRARAAGGLFRGGDRARRALLLAAARAGVAWIDVEHDPSAGALLRDAGPARGIVSWHDRRGTPSAGELERRYARMSAVPGAAVVKIVTTARRPSDLLAVRELLRRAEGGPIPLAAFAMGEVGIASRVLAPSWGSWATYVSLRRGAESAPGQISLEEARDVYRIAEIDAETRLTGITGWPIGHSLSPRMHNAACAADGLNYRYLPFPARSLAGLVETVRALNVRGLSVTAPHKVALARRVNQIEPAARRIGAVNTLIWDGRRLVGLNTDADGVAAPLAERLDPAGRTVAIVGAGGSARAAAVALAALGARVIVASRRERPGRAVARLAGGRWVALRRLHREEYEILVNATPVGRDGRSMPVTPAAVKGSLVGDLVYRPGSTPLLRAAASKGIATFGGEDVLLAQGVAQYTLFTGREAPVAAMRAAVASALLPADPAAG